jgi:uncharacterized membrane protein YeaQ/YmgE (transglycosylase-associated protein family)
MNTDSQMGILANIIVGIIGSGLGHFLAGVKGCYSGAGWVSLRFVR